MHDEHKNKWEKAAEEAWEDEISDDELVEDPNMGDEEPLLEHPSYEVLAQRLTDAEKQAEDYKNRWARERADLDNFKRRSESDLAKAHKYGITKLVEDLIPSIDSLVQGLETKVSGNEAIAKMHQGMELTLQMLQQVLQKYGVSVIDPQYGDAFNPTYHEAMVTQHDPDLEPNKIVKVLQKGYQLHDRLIRPARVMVSKAQ